MAEYMNEALKLAKEALSIGEVPVGCVFVKDGLIIAKGRNTVNETRNATTHAEIVCINYVVTHNKDWRSILKDTEVIVTVEPCIMCAAVLLDLQIKKIVYGCANDRFGGIQTIMNTPKLYSKQCSIVNGIQEDETMELLKSFYKGTNPNAPESKVKIKK
uniref:CMP/dCMP-type deaminase domain-containing protein n=1 Tax=Clastoptera arizonana TaxID=38151 RepID=A0A1B6C6X7_9HEMI